jgi:uncharacterized protein YjbI with pentapeptide repeats/DNA replication protein DnaC
MSFLVKKPVSVLNRNIEFDFPKLFKTAIKGGGNVATGNWLGAASNAVDLAKSLGLEKLEPEQLAWLLICRSLAQAIKDLIEERPELKQDANKLENTIDQINFSTLEKRELEITSDFFQRPKELPIWDSIQDLLGEVLTKAGLTAVEAREISNRLPGYFVLALNQEWRDKPNDYAPLKEAVDTPFTKAEEREQSWKHYSAWLEKQVEEPVFGEAFSLKRIYIPLRAYYKKEKQNQEDEEFRRMAREKEQRVVIKLKEELMDWVTGGQKEDAIRAISGGPGSGKSSFCKMFAANLAETAEIPVLFIPLYLFDPTADLVDEVKKFTRLTKILNHNPLEPEQEEEKLLIIFDGLDELSTQGKLAEEVTRQFVEEVQRKVDRFNYQKRRLLVLFSGREVVVQALIKSSLRQERQVLYLLPYFVPTDERKKKSFLETDEYIDEEGLLNEDQRQEWWRRYGEVRGDDYNGLPNKLNREDLEEITTQPLLNYLVALSHTRGEVNLSEQSNLNAIYADLLQAVHERGWADKSKHPGTGDLNLKEFTRVLEEIAIATWHGNGRTTTVQAIKERCSLGGIPQYLEKFQEGAQGGVTRLLTAFYFRQSGVSKDQETFEFTHKSFGEYLIVTRIARELKKIARKLKAWEDDPEEGWNQAEALKSWAMLCGQSAMDEYLHRFLVNELRLQGKERAEEWQQRLCDLIEFMLKHGMPMERLGEQRPKNHKEECRQARNAEEALLVALSSCASVTEELSSINWQTKDAFGTWLHQLRGQRIDFREEPLVLSCLNFLELSDISLISQDLCQALLRGTDLSRADLRGADLSDADLSDADLSDADLSDADLSDADLSRAHLIGADLRRADLRRADLSRADLSGADLSRAHLSRAHLSDADLSRADLSDADLSRADLSDADLSDADLSRADLSDADLSYADLSRADLSGADLSRADLRDADLSDTKYLRQKQIDSARGDSNTRLPQGLTRPQHWED